MATATHHSTHSALQRTTTAARALLSRLLESARSDLSQCRPWQELLADRSSFRIPESVAEAGGRIRKNWVYFRVNYLILLFLVMALGLLSNPGSLFLIVLLLGTWTFLYLLRREPLVVLNRSYSHREVLAAMTVLTIVVLFFTKVGLFVIWAFMVVMAIVCAHGAFRVPEYDDSIFLENQEAAGRTSLMN